MGLGRRVPSDLTDALYLQTPAGGGARLKGRDPMVPRRALQNLVVVQDSSVLERSQGERQIGKGIPGIVEDEPIRWLKLGNDVLHGSLRRNYGVRPIAADVLA